MSETNGEPLPIDPTEHGIIRGAVSKLHSSLSRFLKETSDGRNLVDIDPAHVLNSLSTITYDANDEIIALRHKGNTFDDSTNSVTLMGSQLVPLIDTKVEYIIEPLCPVATLTLVQGMPKSGKSTFSLWIALCASLGLPPCDLFKIAKPRKTLFVEFEDNPILVAKRSARYLSGAGWDGYAIPDNFNLCDSPTLWLETQKYELLLTKEIQDKGYELVVIDTLSYVHNMDDENASAQMKMVMAALKRIVKATNCSIIMIHHSKKGGQNGTAPNEKARGSSAISAAADVIVDWGDRAGTDVTPVQVISKYDDAFDLSVEYKRTQDGIQWVITQTSGETTTRGRKESNEDFALKTLVELLVSCPEGVTTKAWKAALKDLGVPERSSARYIKSLFETKRVDRQIRGKFVLYTIMGVANSL